MFKNILLILLVGISAFSMFRYVGELRQVYTLRTSLDQAQGEIAILAQEKQNLLQDIEKEKELKEQLIAKNQIYKENLEASNKKIKRLFDDKAIIEENLEEQSSRLAILKAENKALIEGRKRIYSENEQFKAKFNSVAELRKAIRELKAKRSSDTLMDFKGNRGYLIKDGRSTAIERVKIEVLPAQTKE